MSLSIKTNNYLKAEKLNRSEENRYQERLNFLDWQYRMRSKHYDERMEKIRLTMQLLNNSTGADNLNTKAIINKKPDANYPTSQLYLGNRRFWLTGPAARGQAKLNRIRTPSLHSSRKSLEMSSHLGWKAHLDDIVVDSLSHPLLGSDEPYDEYPLTKSFNTDGDVKMGRADRHCRTLNKIGLSLKDQKYLTHAYRSDIKIFKCAQKTHYILNTMNSLQEKKVERDSFRQHLENAKTDPFYVME